MHDATQQLSADEAEARERIRRKIPAELYELLLRVLTQRHSGSSILDITVAELLASDKPEAAST